MVTTPLSPAAAHDAITRWTDLLYRADHTPRERACLDQAWRIADDANTEIAAVRHDPPGSPQVRGSSWCRLALAAYQRLMDAGAYNHLDPPPRCLADPDQIRAWLHSPAGDPGFAHETVAQVWNCGDTFTDDVVHNLTNLVDLAQRAGVWGIPDHPILLWHLAGERTHIDAHLVTIDTPDGARYASGDLATTGLVAPGLTGTEAAIDALTLLTATVNKVLATALHPPQVVDTPPAAVEQPATPAAKSFPPAPTVRPGSGPLPDQTHPTPGTDQPPHRSRR